MESAPIDAHNPHHTAFAVTSPHRTAMASCRSDSLSFLMACSLLFAAAAVGVNAAQPFPRYQSHNLAAVRLQADDMAECWNSLLDLRACTSEVILFFLNGETSLELGRCNAKRVIEHRCWPSMLTSFGFTPDGGDILTNYCDALDTTRRLLPPPTPVSNVPMP